MRATRITALKQIVQRTVITLNAIYKHFCVSLTSTPPTYLRAVTAIKIRKVNWILDATSKTSLGCQPKLAGSLSGTQGRRQAHHPPDPEVAQGGHTRDGIVTVDDRGTGQGSVISPLLANIYLHYCFDLWAERWRRREAQGDMIVVRYADDLAVGFEHEGDARRFLDAMRERLGEFTLSLHPDKTRLIEFGRFAAVDRKRRELANRRPSRSRASPSSAANHARDPSSSIGRPGATACGQS